MGGSVLMDFGGTESCQGLLSRLYNHDHLSFFFQSICIIFVLAHLDANEQTASIAYYHCLGDHAYHIFTLVRLGNGEEC